MFNNMLDNMFSNIAKKIKVLAKVMFWLYTIASLVVAIALIADDDDLIPVALAVLVGGPLSAWVSNFFVYGFGELIDRTVSIDKKTNAPDSNDNGTFSKLVDEKSNINNGVRRCSYCNQLTRTNPCSNCGRTNKSISSTSNNWKCKKCGTENANTNSFCENCGEYK